MRHPNAIHQIDARPGSGSGVVPQLNNQFTRWSTLAGDGNYFRDNWNQGKGTFSNCEFYIGGIATYDLSSLYFTNCLFFRDGLYFWDQNAALTFTLQNCTFYNGVLAMSRKSWQPPSFWTIKNTAFDGTDFWTEDNFNGNTNYTAFDYNAYNSNNLSWQTYPFPYPPTYGTLETVGPHDVIVTSGYNWQSSWLGNYYLPSDSPLIDVGSTTADKVGLYQFTTQTNQVKEGFSYVDIGYHYVAMDPNTGQPYSTYTNGISDYIVDANGNGLPDWWELQYFGNYTHSGNDWDSVTYQTLAADYASQYDPNIIEFTIEATNDYVNTTSANVQLNVAAGIPGFYAIFTNSTATTNWLAFTGTNLTANLGSVDGTYDVAIGLKGIAPTATETWRDYRFYLDRVAPAVTITNPILASGTATVGKPYLQLQGFAEEPLVKLSYDITNAAGYATNLDVSVTGQVLDTNLVNFTTNYFQAYDVPLTNGVNHFTLRMTDRAGNATTTNFNVVLDYATVTAAPVIKLIWPQAGMALSGSSCTIRGTMDDETGDIVAQVVNGDSTMTTLTGLVERNHMFWIENVPLNGTSRLPSKLQTPPASARTLHLPCCPAAST